MPVQRYTTGKLCYDPAMATDVLLPHPLSDELIDVIAQRFRVLAEPMRIKLLDALRDRPATVQELQGATGSSQQNVSKHLGVMFHAGLVGRTRHGTSVHYAIADDTLFALCEQVCGGLQRQAAQVQTLLQGGTQP